MPDASLGFPERVALFALMTFVDDVANPDVRTRYGFTIDGKVRPVGSEQLRLGHDVRGRVGMTGSV